MRVDETGAYACHGIEGSRWYAVQAQPHKERFAASNLENQGFRAFVPRLKKTVRHARKTRTVLAPLFPGYLFVSLDLGRDRWRSVNGTLGVSRLVTAGAVPAPMPGGLVEELVAMTERLGAIRLDHALEPGQRVRFLAGPFADTVGRILALDDAGRARVLMELLGAPRSVSVETDALVPVPG